MTGKPDCIDVDVKFIFPIDTLYASYFLAACSASASSPFRDISSFMVRIGVSKAMQIGYRANIVYWDANATFLDALNGMIFSARDLYGDNSFEMNQVKNAWAAVKVTTLPTISTTSLPIAGGTTSGGGSFEWGDTVILVATPNAGYLFKDWTANGTEVSTSASYSFTVDGSRNLVANFVVVPPTISVTPISNDFGSILVGVVSTPKTFTVTNQGSQPLVIGTTYRDSASSASRSCPASVSTACHRYYVS